MSWETVLQILTGAAGIIVLFICGMAALIWLRTIQPSDVRTRLEDLESAYHKVLNDVRKVYNRDKMAAKRERDRAPDLEEPEEQVEVVPPEDQPQTMPVDRIQDRAAIRAQLRTNGAFRRRR